MKNKIGNSNTLYYSIWSTFNFYFYCFQELDILLEAGTVVRRRRGRGTAVIFSRNILLKRPDRSRVASISVHAFHGGAEH